MNKADLDNFTVDESRKWGILSLLAGLPVYFISQEYMTANRAAILALLVALLIFLVRFYWRLRTKMWFWAAMFIVMAADFAAVAFFPDGKWPNAMIVLAPVAAVQLAATIFLISTVEAALQKRKG